MKTSKIQYHCPDCGKSKMVTRADHDPAAAVRLVNKCPKCMGSDCDDVHYEDADGNETFGDEEVKP